MRISRSITPTGWIQLQNQYIPVIILSYLQSFLEPNANLQGKVFSRDFGTVTVTCVLNMKNACCEPVFGTPEIIIIIY